MNRPRLLFLCQALPYPPDGGVKIRSFNVLRLLSEAYDVSALCFVRGATAANVAESLSALREVATRVEVFPIEQETSRLRLLRDHLESTVTQRVYTVPAYRNRAFRDRLTELLESESYSLAHVDSLDLSGYLPLLSRLPVICTHHNVESALLRRRAAREQSRVRQWYLAMQANLMEREERRWCPAVALNVAVSGADRAAIEELAPGARVTVVPNGVDTERFRPAQRQESGMVFVGGMTWFPNSDALEYFSRDILPLLRDVLPSHAVTWVGRASAVERERFAGMGITMTGYVDSIDPHVHSAACYIVPLRVGGGTRLKILDAWAMGKAVVSTSVGCEGLDARDGWNILVRDDPRSFADAVRRVLTDPGLRASIGGNARATAETTYSWNVIGRHMLSEYEKVRLSGAPTVAAIAG